MRFSSSVLRISSLSAKFPSVAPPSSVRLSAVSNVAALLRSPFVS